MTQVLVLLARLSPLLVHCIQHFDVKHKVVGTMQCAHALTLMS